MNTDDRFYNFVHFFTKHTQATIRALIFLLVAGVMWVAFENRSDLFRIWADNAEERIVTDYQFRQLVEVNQRIQSRLDNLRTATKASRVVVRRFHNGKQDLTSIPFQRVTDVYSSNREDFKLQVDTTQTLPLSAITYSLNRMWGVNASNPVCFGQRTEEFPNGVLKNYLFQHNIKYSHICPVVNIGNYPLGLVAVNVDFVPTEEQAAFIADRTQEAANAIGGYLDTTAAIKGNPPK